MIEKSELQPTSEQVKAQAMFYKGDSLKINAFAGTGKTQTLTMLARSTSRRGTYLAFNRGIAEEARGKFPRWVKCHTIHQLAYRGVISRCQQSRKLTESMNGNYVVELLGLEDLDLSSQVIYSARSRGALILDTVRRYCWSDDDKIGVDHVPEWGHFALLETAEQECLKADVVKLAGRLWGMMTDFSRETPLGHDGYLKQWALEDPVISGEYILLDEGQDTNPVVLGMLNQQQSQVVVAGDRYQQIYQWRGAVNAMEQLQCKKNSYLTKSFRFGPAIAAAATRMLATLGESHAIQGNSKLTSQLGCGRPDAILCRTNVGVMDYYIQALNAGGRPLIAGGAGEYIRLCKGVLRLKNGESSDEQAFFGFKNWREVVHYSRTEAGAHLKTLVGLVERFDETRLITHLQTMPTSERKADLVISTVHKAKGRQWERVWVADDFFKFSAQKKSNIDPDPAETRLMYVALTRARQAVQIPETVAEHFRIRQDFQPLQLGDADPASSKEIIRERRWRWLWRLFGI